MKICTICKIEKSQSEFSSNRRCKGGLLHQCKSCVYSKYKRYRRDWEIQKDFGITISEYENKYKSQPYCLVCKKDNIVLHLDHCHKTKKLRGFLCMNCNRGLGHFQDDPKILKEAIIYLEIFND